MVLVCDGRTEERHDPITRVLVDGAFEAVHPLGKDLEETLEDPVPLLGTDLLRQLCRTQDVGEEHGDLLALTLERTALRQDLLCQVRGGVGLEGLAARRTELRSRRQLRATAGTGGGKPGAALLAEARSRRALMLAGRAIHSKRPRQGHPNPLVGSVHQIGTLGLRTLQRLRTFWT